MTIEVFLCEKSNRLVRGIGVQRKLLTNGMIEYTARCPNHPNEVLRKTDLPHTWTSTATEMFPGDEEVRIITLPADAGTIDQPSQLFWEVFTREMMSQLPEDQRDSAAGLVLLAWQNELSDDEKREMLARFASTGTVRKAPVARLNPKRVQHMPQPVRVAHARRNPDGIDIEKVKAEFITLNRKLHQSEVMMTELISALGEVDPDAALEIDFDLFSIARIVGYDDYVKDIERRSLLVDELEAALGPEALSQVM